MCYSLLNRLSVFVLKDKVAAMRASILFCFNPASIFFSSMYTPVFIEYIMWKLKINVNLLLGFVMCRYSEILYALLSIGRLCHLMSGAKNLSTLWLALSVLAR